MINPIEQIHKKKKIIKRFLLKYIYWKKRLLKPIGSKRVYIIGCPEYSNLGDNAILLAMISFLQHYVGLEQKQIICITEHEFLSDSDILQKCISQKSLLCGVGGGNMGNKYRSEELIRRTMFVLFPTNPIIIFPQTIYYEGEDRYIDEQISSEIYNRCTDLTIVAREKDSKDKMESLYPKAKIMLTPDIVLSASTQVYGVYPNPRNGVLFCTRSDGEKIIDDTVWNSLRSIVSSMSYSHTNTDMYSDTVININTRKDCVKRKMTEFISSELVITDRLHAMIFAALTGTPCIAFNNSNYKIQGTFEWISHLSYVKYVNTYDEAVDLLTELLSMRDNKYDILPLYPYFDKLAKEVAKKI